MVTLRWPGLEKPLNIPWTWKRLLLIAAAFAGAIAIGFMAATLLSGGSDSSTTSESEQSTAFSAGQSSPSDSLAPPASSLVQRQRVIQSTTQTFEFPTVEELEMMDISSPPYYTHPDLWNWGTYEINERWRLPLNDAVATRLAEDLLWSIQVFDKNLYVDEESLKVADWLNKSLVSNQSIPRKIYSVQVAPDYSIEPEILTKKVRVGVTQEIVTDRNGDPLRNARGAKIRESVPVFENRNFFLFSSLITITFKDEEGKKKNLQFRVKTQFGHPRDLELRRLT